MKSIRLILLACITISLLTGCKSDLSANHSTGSSAKVLKGWEIEQSGVVTVTAKIDSELIGKEMTFNLTDFKDDNYSVKYTPESVDFDVEIYVAHKGNYFPQVMLLDENIIDTVSLTYTQKITIEEAPSTYVVPL